MVKSEGNESISVPFLLYHVFERMHAALYNGSERGILIHSYLFASANMPTGIT